MNLLSLVMALVVHTLPTQQYDCRVTAKGTFTSTGFSEYSQENLDRFQHSVRLVEAAGSAILSRCSWTITDQRMTCDNYTVDRVEVDQNVEIRKYYYFRGQFDFQLFPNMTFLENNGRGGIAFGTCRET